MRITAFNGSPRKERGNTHVITSAFLEGARDAGAEVENILLAEKSIKPCLACFSCWTKTPGRCVHHDDMADLLATYLSSDAIVFASPVYVDNVTGIMKMFMDRLIPAGDPHMVIDENGECRHVRRHEKPTKIIAISNCGFPEQSHFQVLRILFRRIARNLSCSLVAEIYRGGGGLLTDPRPEIRRVVEDYCGCVRRAGAEIVNRSGLSAKTIEELERPLIPQHADVESHVLSVNRIVDSRLEKRPGSKSCPPDV